MVDAEHTYFQPLIDHLVLAHQPAQVYRRDTLHHGVAVTFKFSVTFGYGSCQDVGIVHVNHVCAIVSTSPTISELDAAILGVDGCIVDLNMA